MKKVFLCLFPLLMATKPVEVQVHGKLMNIMHQGDIGPKVNLQEVKNKHTYGLGAASDLKGEILIWDGTPYHAKVTPSGVSISTEWNTEATLLVSTTVKKWVSQPVPDSVTNPKELQDWIAEQTTDIDTPLPFRLTGKVPSLSWHVIDWPEGDTEHTHQKHVTSGAHGTIKDTQVDILGFHSTKHHGVFTHHSSNLHMHVRSTDGLTLGHVDDLTLGTDLVLWLPKR